MRPLPRGETGLDGLEFRAGDNRLVVSLDDLSREHEVPRVGRVAEHVPDPRAPRAMRSLLVPVVPSHRAVLVLEHTVDELRLARTPIERFRDLHRPEPLQKSVEHGADFLRLRLVDKPLAGAPPLALWRRLGPPITEGHFLTEFDIPGPRLLVHPDQGPLPDLFRF